MPFETGSISFRMYHMARPLPEPPLAGFQRRIAPPLDTIRDLPVYGWVSGRHLLDRQLNEQTAYLGGFLRLCLLKAERRIPTSLLRAELQQEEMIRLTVSGNPTLTRKDKTELKREIVDRLLPTMPPQLKGMTFVHRPGGQWVYAETPAEKQVEVFCSYLKEAWDCPPEVINPESLSHRLGRCDPRQWAPCSFSETVGADQTSPLPGHDFMTWLWYQSEQNPDRVPAGKIGEVGVLLEGPLTLVMEGGGAHETALRKGHPTRSAEAKAGLLAGKKLRRAAVNLVRNGQVWRLNLDGETMTVRGFRPAMPEQTLDFLSLFQDRMLQVELLSETLCGLFDAFVQERKSPERWQARVREMQKWIKERSGAC